jgi:hypothetical protein
MGHLDLLQGYLYLYLLPICASDAVEFLDACPVTCCNIKNLCILPPQCICVFRKVLTINSDYFRNRLGVVMDTQCFL